jgi:hypothetical protein
MHCGAKEENAVLVPKPLKINGSRSVHAELGVTGVTFAEVSSGGRYGTRQQRRVMAGLEGVVVIRPRPNLTN